MNYNLKYYYNLDDIQVVRKRNVYYIKTSQDVYYLQEFHNIEKVKSIVNLLNEMILTSNFDQIIKTNFNTIYFETNQKKYILIKAKKVKRQSLMNLPIKLTSNKYDNIKRNNWYMLWLLKNKKMKETVTNKYTDNIINEMFDFFIGLAENALLYLKENSANKNNVQLFISHERVNSDVMNNPLNIVIDRRERDIAEMIKYLYFQLDNYDIEIKKIIQQSLRENLSLEIIFARVIYPTYYFDFIDGLEVINKYDLKKILNYDLFLKKVYEIICANKKIKKIDWL